MRTSPSLLNVYLVDVSYVYLIHIFPSRKSIHRNRKCQQDPRRYTIYIFIEILQGGAIIFLHIKVNLLGYSSDVK